MNLNAIMKKLQRAIIGTGLIMKIGTTQFYSPEQDRMITMYILSTPILSRGRGGWRMRDYEIIRTASQVEVVYALRDIWMEAKEWIPIERDDGQ